MDLGARTVELETRQACRNPLLFPTNPETGGLYIPTWQSMRISISLAHSNPDLILQPGMLDQIAQNAPPIQRTYQARLSE